MRSQPGESICVRLLGESELERRDQVETFDVAEVRKRAHAPQSRLHARDVLTPRCGPTLKESMLFSFALPPPYVEDFFSELAHT